MTIKNVSREPVMLTGIEADIAMMSEVHETLIDAAAVASMSPAGAIEIPAGETVIFAPFGRHIMLMNLLRPMEEGTRCLLTLYFGDHGALKVEVPVLSAKARGPED